MKIKSQEKEMVTLKTKLLGLLFGIGVFINFFSIYWYAMRYNDLSQMIAFCCIGVSFVVIALISQEYLKQGKRIGKMEDQIEYFEDNLLIRFPKLRRRR